MRHLLFAFLLLSLNVSAQILSDTVTKQIILAGLDQIYQGEFAGAEQNINKLKEKYPQHPIVPFMQAMKISWQNLPIERNIPALKNYQQQLQKCLDLATPMLEKPETMAEAKFFILAGHGFKSLSLTYQREYLKAGNEARQAYAYLKDGMKLMESNPEFYYTTGLYNFYVEQYPETHPVIKPVMFFFGDGNKKLGLEQLALAAKKGIFVKTEALYYLMNTNLKYENNISKALVYSKILTEKYPNNHIYLIRHTEGLILAGKLEEAISYIQVIKKNTDRIYQVSGLVLEAMIAEREKDDKKANIAYLNALKMPLDERYTKLFHAYAWAGLARIANRKEDIATAKSDYKKCLEIAEYKAVRAEAENYLKINQ